MFKNITIAMVLAFGVLTPSAVIDPINDPVQGPNFICRWLPALPFCHLFENK